MHIHNNTQKYLSNDISFKEKYFLTQNSKTTKGNEGSGKLKRVQAQTIVWRKEKKHQ